MHILPLFCATIAAARFLNVQVIYTGGTIGMNYDHKGELVPGASGVFQNKISMIASSVLKPNQKKTLDMEVEVKEITPLLDSCNMGLQEWHMIADCIVRSKADAFIIVHGTDTMAYTSSALSFMLYNLQKPVVITGSQIPLCNPNSDGIANLAGSFLAVRMMYMRQIHIVAVFFAKMLMRGVTVTKSSAVNLDAFDNPGSFPYSAIAETIQFEKSRFDYEPTSNYLGNLVTHLSNQNPVRILPLESQVGVFTITPDFDITLLDSMLSNCRGLVLLTYGANNVPSNRQDMLQVLNEHAKQGKLIVSISQVYHKSNTVSEYETGNALKNIGIVDGSAMTFEATIIKMRWLLATRLSVDWMRRAMNCNFLGEYPGNSRSDCAEIWKQIGIN